MLMYTNYSLFPTHFLDPRHFHVRSSRGAPPTGSWVPRNRSRSRLSDRGCTCRGTDTWDASRACVSASVDRSRHCWGTPQSACLECCAPRYWSDARQCLEVTAARLRDTSSACACELSSRRDRRCVHTEYPRDPRAVVGTLDRAGPRLCCRDSHRGGCCLAGVPGRRFHKLQCSPYV